MDFSKKGIEEQLRQLDSSTARIGNKAGIYALRLFLFGVAAVITAIVCTVIGGYRGIIAGTPSISEVNIMPLGQASFIYDADGNLLQKLNTAGGNRVSISIDEIPLNMQHAIVAIEDSRFYEHNGVDPQGMLRALAVAVSTGLERTEGASTITQQLIKNNVFTDWTTESRLESIFRKLQEQHLAIELEDSLTKQGKNAKDTILENYLNTVYFGSNNYGVEAAAQFYFGKDAADLTLSECAVLAAIPQNPSRWNPYYHPMANQERQQTVLKYMLQQGFITEEEYNGAMTDDVYTRIEEAGTASSNEQPYSYFVDKVISQVKQDLMDQKGYTAIQANAAIYSGGLKIYTTQNAMVQAVMDDEFSNAANFPETIEIGLDWAMTLQNEDGEQQNYSREMLQLYFRNTDPSFDLVFNSQEEAQSYIEIYKAAVIGPGDSIVAEWATFTPEPQAAMTVIDQRTGHVLGIVGGRGRKEASLTLDRATDSYRQPGSTFKILSTYGPALDLNYITLATHIADEPFQYANGGSVHNADGQFHGDVTVRTAIQNSYNVVAVKTITDITPQTGMNYLLQLGFEKLIDDPAWDVVQPLALGGVTNGVSNLELTAAYAAVANGGIYTEPVFYTQVVSYDGEVLLETAPVQKRVFKESTAYLLTSAMQDVMASGTGVDFQLNNMTVAGKTGTTTSYRDLVFAGFTPYYTSAIWAGYDTNVEMPEAYRQYYKTLWVNVMNRIHSGLDNVPFSVPSSVRAATVCAQSGKLAGRGCTRVTEFFSTDNMPAETCTEHYVKPTPTPAPLPTQVPTPTPAPEPTLIPATPTPEPTPDVEAVTPEPEIPPETSPEAPEGEPGAESPGEPEPPAEP